VYNQQIVKKKYDENKCRVKEAVLLYLNYFWKKAILC